MAGKMSMCVVVLVMLMAFTNVKETVAGRGDINNCCGQCYSVCSQPLIGRIDMDCIKGCFKACGDQCADIHQ